MPEPFRVPDDLVTHGLEFLPDGLVAAVGRDATVKFMNRRAETVSGFSASVVVGHDIREALPLQDLEGRSWWEVTDPWGGLATRTGHRERLLVLPTGRELLVSAKYIRRGRGEPVRAVVLGLRSAMGRRRAEKEHAALLTTVAHELRSPLTGVKGFSTTLLRNWDRFTDDQKRLMLETIEADADRLTRLISELLDASRIDAGRLTVHPQPLDVRQRLVAQVERRVASGASRDRFVIDVPEDLGPLWADPDRLEQVITNLVENAVRHGRGTVRLAARPTVAAGRPAVDLLVSDDGNGIAEQHRELVFSRFWQEGARHGTGLGLYLVRGLVEAHGGEVRAEAAPGGGALLRATFPGPD
jgi:signal transduction histidine kinase